MYVIQLTIVLLYIDIVSSSPISIFSKLFTVLIIISYLLFTLERRKGCEIKNFSTLDLLVINIIIGGLVISLIGFPISSWKIMNLFAIWFSTRFIFCRTKYFS